IPLHVSNRAIRLIFHNDIRFRIQQSVQVNPYKNVVLFCISRNGADSSSVSEKILPPPQASESVGRRLPHISHNAPMSHIVVYAQYVESRPVRNRLLFVLVVKIPATSVAALPLWLTRAAILSQLSPRKRNAPPLFLSFGDRASSPPPEISDILFILMLVEN